MVGIGEKTLVEVEGLTKRFKEKVAVENLTFSIREGEVFGLLGPNGAGKTTTIRMLLGLGWVLKSPPHARSFSLMLKTLFITPIRGAVLLHVSRRKGVPIPTPLKGALCRKALKPSALCWTCTRKPLLDSLCIYCASGLLRELPRASEETLRSLTPEQLCTLCAIIAPEEVAASHLEQQQQQNPTYYRTLRRELFPVAEEVFSRLPSDLKERCRSLKGGDSGISA